MVLGQPALRCSDELMWLTGRCSWTVAEAKDLAREDR
jgi:hypothetical protein